MTPLDPFISRVHIAYFSMEIAIRPEMRTYAGGLGVLAGDTARSCADLEVPVVFVTLASHAGYFRQTIDASGSQCEEPDLWQIEKWCQPLQSMIAVEIGGRPVWIRPWLYVQSAPHGSGVPILLLDTDLDQNAPADRQLTDRLYGGDTEYRMKQEIVLGLGGIRTLHALGFEIHTHHMNEGHAALLTLDLINRHTVPLDERIAGEPAFDIAEVRERCVFTTHTPVEAGHDRFSYELFGRMLPGFVEPEALRGLAGPDQLNMTRLALNLSGYVNGVARRHAETTEHMFPGYRIHAVTNGVHPGTWTHASFARLFDAHVAGWKHEPELLVRIQQIDEADIWRCHLQAKSDLVDRVRATTGVALDPARPVIGFARRMTSYKRPMLLFSDLERLRAIAREYPFQIVLAGKAHPADAGGKRAIREIHDIIAELDGDVRAVFLPDYDMESARTLTSGCDVWLNTPLPPMEASGTSGMKAALNGVLNLSVLDGWWVEACLEGTNGWAIGVDGGIPAPGGHAEALYQKLHDTVLPLYHETPQRWQTMSKQAIATIAYYFNSHRMLRRYATEAYLR